MELGNGIVVAPENDTRIDSAQGIDLHADPAHAEHGSDPFPVGRLTSAHQNEGAIREFRSISKEHHIEAGASQLPGGDTCEPHPVGTVQHLDEPAVLAGGNRVGMALDLVRARPKPHGGGGHNEDREEARDDQTESAAWYGKREFQKRTVGSGTVHPDRIT